MKSIRYDFRCAINNEKHSSVLWVSDYAPKPLSKHDEGALIRDY